MDEFQLLGSGTEAGIIDRFAIGFQQFLIQFGDSPVLAMAWIFTHGGWIILLITILWMMKTFWVNWIGYKAILKKEWVLLAVDIPRVSEQTVKAMENMFAHLAGAHGSPTFFEKWFTGFAQDTFSFEIISIEGHVQFLMRCTTKYRDLLEASIFAQYPDSEITEVEDYTHSVPSNYPDEHWDCFGTEWEYVTSDVYPLKSYMDFEHQLSGEFKDPLAVLLEGFSRLGPGEQAWYQILVEPIGQKEFVAKALREVQKITGQKPEVKKGKIEKVLDFPLTAMSEVAEVAFGTGIGTAGGEIKKEQNPLTSRMWSMTPGERNVVEGIERKASKIQFLCKMRFVYVGKKEVFQKSRVAQPLVGTIKQFNTNDMGALKPETSHVIMSSALLFFKNRRNNARKRKLIEAYKTRSMWIGASKFHLSTEELASFWHLPIPMQVKAPQVKKTEAKKAEPPMNLPLE